MSRMIPQETIDVMRGFNDVSVDLYGIDCELRIPVNLNQLESKDAYAAPSELSFKAYKNQKVFIEWKAAENVLRKLGVFTEGQAPIIAWFKNAPMVTLHSYIIVPLQYIPKELSDVDEFEIVDRVQRGMHDALLINAFKLAPRRVRRV